MAPPLQLEQTILNSGFIAQLGGGAGWGVPGINRGLGPGDTGVGNLRYIWIDAPNQDIAWKIADQINAYSHGVSDPAAVLEPFRVQKLQPGITLLQNDPDFQKFVNLGNLDEVIHYDVDGEPTGKGAVSWYQKGYGQGYVPGAQPSSSSPYNPTGDLNIGMPGTQVTTPTTPIDVGSASPDQLQAYEASLNAQTGATGDNAVVTGNAYTGYGDPWSAATAETYGPVAEYQRRLGLTTGARDPYQRYQEAQFNPLLTSWNIGQQFPLQYQWGGQDQAWTAAPAFSDYYTRPQLDPRRGWEGTTDATPEGGTAAQGYGPGRTAAREMLGRLAGMTPAQRQGISSLDMDGAGPDIASEPYYFGPWMGVDPETGSMDPGARSTKELQTLLRWGLRGGGPEGQAGLGAAPSRWLASQVPALEREWLAQRGNVGPASSQDEMFLDYIIRKYGLERYIQPFDPPTPIMAPGFS